MKLRRAAAGLLAVAIGLVVAGASVAATPSHVVISQVYGGGGNSGAPYTHDYVELFNPTAAPISLAGMSIQYASATGTGNFGGTATQLTELSGTVAPGAYFLVQQAAGAGNGVPLPTPDLVDPTPIAMAAGSGKVALVTGTTSLGCNGSSDQPCSAEQLARIVDLVGYGGANFFEGSSAAPTLSNTTAAFRAEGGCVDTNDNGDDFAAAAPAPRTSASPANDCEAEPGDAAPAVSSTAPANGATNVALDATISITFSEPVAVSGAWFSIQCATSGSVSATVSGGPTTFTLTPAAPFERDETCTVTVVAANVTDLDTDDPPDTMAADHTFSFTTVPPVTIIPIGEVQGPVLDTDVGPLHRSPFAPPTGNGGGDLVTVQGVIYQRTLARSSSGASQHGFFIQNTAATGDGDPLTSDGIFVFMGGFTDLIGGYVPTVGDEVVITGRVSEFFNFTQLSSARLESLVSTMNDLEAVVPAVEADPPDDLQAAGRYWERIEGMRTMVPAGSAALNGRDVFSGTADSEIWLVNGDHPIAQRDDPYARRSFRDPHPLDNRPDVLFDDGNGYRIMIASYGVKAAAGDNTVLLNASHTFSTLENSPVGGVYFTFSKYAVMVEQQPQWAEGVDPAENAPPEPFNRARAYSVANYNVENLYDFRDDPFDGCDFVGNAGCPGVSPPFNYVPESDEVYQHRLREVARQIVHDIHAPDVILIQETEDQDICAIVAEALACGATNDRDGRPDTLQELALAILELGGPEYDAAADRDGADDRGIISAFMFRTDRVELLEPDAGNPVLGSDPEVEYRGEPLPYNTDVQNPKVLNAVLPADVDRSTGVDGTNVFTRAPQIGLFRVWRIGVGISTFVDLYASSNHFSSTPDARVGQRTEQSAYLAAVVAAMDRPRAVAGGDFNVFPRPDDPFSPGHPLFPSDQLAPLYDAGLFNLYDLLVEEVPASAYTYVFQGQAQTLDHQMITPTLKEELRTARVAHVNADFPRGAPENGRGASDHDPLVAQYAHVVDVASLIRLVEYYAAAGAIRGVNTTEILLDRLERAQRLLDAGDRSAYLAQLQAFANQVQGFAPRFVDQEAADALAGEANALRSTS